jgi:hypothetical protein
MLFAYINLNKFRKYERLTGQFDEVHEAMDNASKVLTHKINFAVLSAIAILILLYLTFA